MATILLPFILQKNYRIRMFIFFEDVLPYIILGPCFKWC